MIAITLKELAGMIKSNSENGLLFTYVLINEIVEYIEKDMSNQGDGFIEDILELKSIAKDGKIAINYQDLIADFNCGCDDFRLLCGQKV